MRTVLVAALAALVLAAPATATSRGNLNAEAVTFQAEVREEGLIQFVHLERNATGPAAAVTMTIQADRITTTQYESEGPEAVVPGTPVTEEQIFYTGTLPDSLPQGPDPVENTGTVASLVVDAAQPAFTMLVFNPTGTLHHAAQCGSPRLSVLQQPVLTQDGILPGVAVQNQGDGEYWSQVHADAPHVVSRTGGQLTATWRGDFTLEVVGLSGYVEAAERSWAFESGRTADPFVDGQPGQENLRNVREVFVRMAVEGGTLTFSAPDAHAAWSGPNLLSTYVTGAAVLQSASGMVEAAGGETVRVSSPKLELEGPQGLASRPEGNGLDLDLVPVDGAGRPIPEGATVVSPPDAILEGVLAGSAVLVVGLSLTYLFYRRTRRLPILADVEAALEASAFRRAARDARRILARRPDSEDAMLSRAIALSKSGRHRAVVREVRHHLQVRRPTDGVLHYVLGVAQHELGRLEEARTSFEEAVRRTPALLKDVQERLGRAAASSAPAAVPKPSPPEPRDASGYA